MFPAIEGMPTPLGTLDSLLDTGDASEKPYKVFIGHNLGHRSFLFHLPMHEFFELSEVANDPARDGDQIAQRKLDPAHAQKLAVYILKGLVSAAIQRFQIQKKDVGAGFTSVMEKLGRQPYMSLQPIVVNIRNCDPAGSNIRGERLLTKQEETAGFKVFLSQKHVLWVIDGQHRRKAMSMVFDFLDQVRGNGTYPKKPALFPAASTEVSPEETVVWEECFAVARSYCTVTVEVHLGLSVDEERQLFHDLNNLGKKVEASLALNFDNSNPVNIFIKEKLIGQLGLDVIEKDVTDWHSDTGAISRKDLVAVNAILFLNKTNIGGATPPMVTPKEETAYRFWETVAAIPGFGDERARENTVAAQPVVLKALAKLVYAFAFSNRRDDLGDEHLETLLNGITDIDFSHDNAMWRYFELSEAERNEFGLSDLGQYLPSIESGNRDIGKFQNGVMRFGAKHNDIAPVLGDMIRWKLKLPNRNAKALSELTLQDL